jgi:hypothetical protein
LSPWYRRHTVATVNAQTSQLAYDDLTRDPQDVIAGLRAALLAGEPWLPALLAAIKRWRVPHEVVDERHYYYLVGSEAFDWMLLAERLLEAVADLVPENEREALLFAGQSAYPLDAATLKREIGPVKYRAHLNFLYGVTVEEALQLSVEEEINKELRCRAWGFDRRLDESVYHRIYLKSRDDLLAAFREQRNLPHGTQITFPELKEFTYWLFKYRLAQCDRAKVAADTRRGLAQLAKLDNVRHGAPSVSATDTPPDFIDIRL